MGPEIPTAAITLLFGPRTGADTDATPASRSPTDCAQPRRLTAAKCAAVNLAFPSARCIFSESSQEEGVLHTSGKVPEDWWVMAIAPRSQKEYLGYPTQKPLALMDRIIRAASNPGDIVLDPFCGCGTTIAAAETLWRQWVGIDVTHLAISLIKKRLVDSFGPDIETKYETKGEPMDLAGAQQLADEDKFQFQAWALGKVNARHAAGQSAKRGADGGIDGRLFFHDGAESDQTRRIVISVKGGKLKADDVRALEAVRARDNAEIGVLISMNKPTKGMRADAASAGHYTSSFGGEYPRIQLLTVEDLFDGRTINYPAENITTKKAPRRPRSDGEQLSIGD